MRHADVAMYRAKDRGVAFEVFGHHDSAITTND
jgi:hypothetical protein